MRHILTLAIALAVSFPLAAGETIVVDENHSFADALAKARAIHASSSEVVTISLAPGVYRITRPVHLLPEDSHLCIEGAGMGESVICGGIEAPEWKVGKDGVWTVDLSSLMPSGGSVPQLYVGGVRAVCARTPNGIEMLPTPSLEETVISENALTIGHTSLAVDKLHIGALLEGVNPAAASGRLRINYHHKWDITRRYLWGYDPSTGDLYHFGTAQKPWNHTHESSQVFFDNDKAFLDEPGEYFFDDNRALLYYIPREGQDPLRDRAQIPCARRIFHFKGAAGARVSDITIKGLTLCCTRFDLPYTGFDPEQGAASTDAAVMANFTDGVHFEDCEMSLLGNNAVWFRTSCRDCSLERCHIHDLGIGGVKIGDPARPREEEEEDLLTRRVKVNNCIITAGGREITEAIGVMIFNASDCEVTHNEISDFYYSGVSVGWVWGYAHSPSKRNVIEYNHIHHLGWGLLSDMGGVYTLGKSEGTSVSHNRIHDIYSYSYGGWGLYTDEGSTGVTMAYNLVYNCKDSGFHQHYGQENLIANNIFWNNQIAQLQATRVEDGLSLTFERNVVCFERGKLWASNWGKAKICSEHNLYWNGSQTALFGGQTLKEWVVASGRDASSLVADPKFADPAAGDFTMGNKRALKKIGFVAFDPFEAGVYGSSDWIKLAEMPASRIELYNATIARYQQEATAR